MAAELPCRSCRAPIRFVPHELGKTMCLNAEPDQVRGNISINNKGVARTLTGRFLDAARAVGTPLYLSHHATCPQREQWSRKAS